MKPRDDREQLILLDGELRLRPARLPDDIFVAEAWYQDPEVMRFSEGDENACYDREMIGKMYRYLSEKGELYIIEHWKGESWLPIGDATLAPDTIPINIGVAAYRAKGFGKRTLKLLIDRARALGWRELKVKRVYTTNLRSRRLYESLGFRQDGGIFSEESLPSWRFVLRLQ